MTVGVMAPLVWTAYVSRPAQHAAHTPKVMRAETIPEAQRPARAAAEDITASIPLVPAAIPAPPKAVQAAVPPSKPDAPPLAIMSSPAKRTAKFAHTHPKALLATHRAEKRYLPAVVDSYNGAHIITVCAALTVDEQLRAGCP